MEFISEVACMNALFVNTFSFSLFLFLDNGALAMISVCFL